MNSTQVITLKIPAELKDRLQNAAQSQGVSLNNLATYLLTTELSRLEFFMRMERRLGQKNLSELKPRVAGILDTVPLRKDLPEWDNPG